MRLPTYDKPRIISLRRGPSASHRPAARLSRRCSRTADRPEDSTGRPRRAARRTAAGRDVSRRAAAASSRLAADAMLTHDTGVLAATTAFGKTVVAAWLIAQRGVNTLVLVHRRQLLDQWVERLAAFLDVPAKSIGRIGGGRNKPTGLHRCGRHSKPRPQRRRRRPRGRLRPSDRRRMPPSVGAQLRAGRPPREGAIRRWACPRRSRGRTATIRSSSCSADRCGIASTREHRRRRGRSSTRSSCVRRRSSPAERPDTDKRIEFQALYQRAGRRRGAQSHASATTIVQAVRGGRSPLVLTERNEHLDRLERAALRSAFRHFVVLRGGMGKKDRRGSGGAAGGHPARRRARPAGHGQVHRRRIRRCASGHVVSDAAGLVARHDRAIRRPAAPTLRRQARGARVRLRRPQRADAGAHVRSALPRI